MDQATYQQWWQLHLRVARGESLSPDEQSNYDVGLREMEREPPLHETAAARQSREELAALENERAELERQKGELDAEIAELESRLSDQTRQYLGVED